MRRISGFTLAELLIGAALFSIVLTLVALCFQVSDETLEVSNRDVPVEIALQNGTDSATRLIRQSKDATGGGRSVQLTQWNNSVSILYLNNGTLMWNNTPLQTGLQNANFTVQTGDAGVKLVEIALAASSKNLISAVSLRNVPAGASNSTTVNSSAPVTATSPAPTFPIPHPIPHCNPCSCVSHGTGCGCIIACPQ